MTLSDTEIVTNASNCSFAASNAIAPTVFLIALDPSSEIGNGVAGDSVFTASFTMNPATSPPGTSVFTPLT